jgi:hypothetical protein
MNFHHYIFFPSTVASLRRNKIPRQGPYVLFFMSQTTKSTSNHAMGASAVHQTSSMKAMMAFARVRSILSITSMPQRSKSRVRCCLASVHSRYKLASVSLSLLLHTLLISYEKTDLDPSCASSFSSPAKSEDLRWNVCLSLF